MIEYIPQDSNEEDYNPKCLGQNPTPKLIKRNFSSVVLAAIHEYHDGCLIQIDADPKVAESDDGCWVAAWVWVED